MGVEPETVALLPGYGFAVTPPVGDSSGILPAWGFVKHNLKKKKFKELFQKETEEHKAEIDKRSVFVWNLNKNFVE